MQVGCRSSWSLLPSPWISSFSISFLRAWFLSLGACPFFPLWLSLIFQKKMGTSIAVPSSVSCAQLHQSPSRCPVLGIHQYCDCPHILDNIGRLMRLQRPSQTDHGDFELPFGVSSPRMVDPPCLLHHHQLQCHHPRPQFRLKSVPSEYHAP